MEKLPPLIHFSVLASPGSREDAVWEGGLMASLIVADIVDPTENQSS